jgi:hypothetical protein
MVSHLGDDRRTDIQGSQQFTAPAAINRPQLRTQQSPFLILFDPFLMPYTTCFEH